MKLLIISVVIFTLVHLFEANNENVDQAVHKLMKEQLPVSRVFDVNALKKKISKVGGKNADCSVCAPGRGICGIPKSPQIGFHDPIIVKWGDVRHCGPNGKFYFSECTFNCLRIFTPSLTVTSCGDHLANPQQEGLEICTTPAVSGSCAGDLLYGPI